MFREKEIYGKPALNPGPSVHVLSISLQSEAGKPLVIYGSVNVQFSDSVYGGMIGHYIYKRERPFPETLDPGCSLTLNGPGRSCQPDHAFMPMFRSRINAKLFDKDDHVFANESFSLDDNIEGVHEQVLSKCLPCEQGLLIVKYIAIPLAVYCRIEVLFYNKKVSQKRDSVNVNGNIVARCVNSHENSDLEDTVLFQKQENEYEKVETDRGRLKLSRYWVALPAYSSIVVALALSEYETGQKIVNDIVEFEPQPGLMFSNSLVLDNFYIKVRVSWFSPSPLRPIKENDPEEEEEEEKEAEEEEGEEEMDTEGQDEDSSGDDELYIPWGLRPHKSKPCLYPAVEIFSVFVDREKAKEIDIFGSIEVLLGDSKFCTIFKTDQKNPLHLSEDVNFMPILDGSRLYEYFNPLEMKLNLTSVCGNLNIKGYVDYGAESLDGSYFWDKQLCSFIQGRNGFATVHYSLFSNAVGAYVRVFMNFNMERGVYGCVTCQYRYFDYSSSYNKEHYRSVLFMKTRDDPVEQSIDGLIPLARSSVVVPSYSPLIINIDLSSGSSRQRLLDIVEIGIGEGGKIIKTSDCVVRVEVDWCEIK